MSPENTDLSYDFIKCYLEQKLEDKKPHLELFSDPTQLLIMESQKDVAAFAVMNGHPQKLFETAYEHFKKLYNERNKDWANRYLSFVLCRTKESIQEDSFYNELENDVYFCKKYVVHLIDQSRFKQEIQRLPFIPLRPESIDALKRPVSAQTLLQKCGLDTELARHLVKAKESTAITISRKYLAKDYDHNPFNKPEGIYQTTDDSAMSKVSTRLRSLTIENFRAYKHQEFDLNGDIIILYGPNGLGKTSFYDALDFACTGRIARLKGKTKISKVATHLDSTPDKSYVKIEIESGPKTDIITRTVDDHIHAKLNNKKIRVKKLLSHLTGLIWEDTAARQENFEKLFRATHLFGQDYQELLADYLDNSKLSEEIVARMLAFEDYVAADKKTQQVVNSLRRNKETLLDQLDMLNLTLSELTKRQKELAKTIKAVSTPEAVAKLANKIGRRVKKELNLDLPTLSSIDKDGIRSWRATVSGNIEVIQKQLYLSVVLEEQFNLFIKSKENLIKKKKTLQQSTNDMELTKKKIENIQEEQKTLLKAFRVLTSQRDKLLKKQSFDTWNLNAIKNYNRRSNTKSKLQLKLKEYSLPSDKNLEELETDENELRWIKNNLTKWKESSQQLKGIRIKLKKAKVERQSLEKQYNSNKIFYKAKQEKLLNIESTTNSIRENDSELSIILDNIGRIIKGPICPVCGTDHNTERSLLQKIKKQKTRRSPENERIIRDFQGARREVNDLEKSLESLKRKILIAQKHEKSIDNDFIQLNEMAQEFQERAKLLGLKTNRNLTNVISSKLEQLRLLKKYAVTEMDLENLVLEAKTKKLSLNTKVKELQDALHKTKEQILELEENINVQETQNKNVEKKLNLLNDELKKLEKKQATINDDISNLMRKISEYENSLSKLNLKDNSNIEIIKLTKDKLKEQSKIIYLIKDEIIHLETAIDSAQSSARLAELDSEIEKTKNKQKEQQAEIKEIENAIDYFKKARDILIARKNSAVSEYTKNIGPLTSIIQQRLRSVYGFGPVFLKARAGTIYVQVSRKAEELKPINYFSDSQNQILMLSLFLSAGITQTWSSFAPILMDDPITHFDDLNAYAFVEFIRGLIDETNVSRQFIISTCDESLWNLFRQRFSNLNGRAIMYKFAAIGGNGPVVKRIV